LDQRRLVVDLVSSFIVHRPLNLFIIAALFVIAYLVLHFTGLGEARRPGLLLVPAVAWGLYAAWEWLVMTRTPEANIRVDLLITLPVMLALSVLFVFKALRHSEGPS
jgi:hypothetical protein